MQEGSATRTSQASVSAALAAANAAARAAISSETRFPGEDGGRSLAEMAYRDLDATLQLLADRAQYITGSTGAAIALRRVGKNDMLCRASSGSNAPELGALLSAEFGLSGESVRTRQALRCDDAERDARVNREVCRQMGIASVVVMPVVHDDEVLGVFELFSGEVNAFGERDLSALQRLSEMVETAVKLAHAVQQLPERLKSAKPAAEAAADEILDESILEIEPDLEVLATIGPGAPVPAQALELAKPEIESARVESAEVEDHALVDVQAEAATPSIAHDFLEVITEEPAPGLSVPGGAAALAAPYPDQPVAATSAVTGLGKKPMFWSASGINADALKPADVDQSHVPPVLRNLRKCEVCGFPVSAGRALCVECDDKKWRGQLKRPQAAPRSAACAEGKLATTTFPSGPQAKALAGTSALSGAASAPVERAFAAAAQSSHAVVSAKPVAFAGAVIPETPAKVAQSVSASLSKPLALSTASISASTPAPAAALAGVAPEASPAPELVLSAGLAPSQSWFATNKYILGALLVVGAVVAGVFLLR